MAWSTAVLEPIDDLVVKLAIFRPRRPDRYTFDEGATRTPIDDQTGIGFGCCRAEFGFVDGGEEARRRRS
jgi:hypothetical protein